MYRSTVLGAVLSAALIILPQSQGYAGPVVVELFTSQGCSSCPPADELLGELAELDDVIALSLPVDYWDYLGWKDSFGSPVHSERQKSYALSRGDRSVYTPQIVVDGKDHVVGSDRRQINRALKRAKDHAIDIDLQTSGDMVKVTVPGQTNYIGPDGVIWLMAYSKSEPVSIGRGENAGRKVTYYNVVRKMVRIGTWDGEEQTFDIPMGLIADAGATGCAIVIQQDVEGGAGPVIGAALMDNS